MTTKTIAKLDNLVNLLVSNAHYAQPEDFKKIHDRSLEGRVAYAIRKEAKMILDNWGINAVSIAKTPEQMNYVVDKVAWQILNNNELSKIWLG